MPGVKRKMKSRRVFRARRKKDVAVAKQRTTVSLSGPLQYRLISPMPSTFKTVLRYHEYAINVDPAAAGITALYQFRANDCYDPNWTAGGHQPTGFDQIMALYTRGHVLRSKINVIAMNEDATNEVIVGLTIRDRTSAPGSAQELIENGASQIKFLTSQDNAHPSASLTAAVDVGKWMGKKNVQDDDSLFFTASSAPSDVIYYSIFAHPNNTTTDNGIVGLVVTIDYEVVFSERQPLAIS